MTKSTNAKNELKLRTKSLLIVGTLIFLLLFVGLGGWLSLAKISGAVIGSGVVAVQGKPKILQHLDGGIITDINVENGDFVGAGDILLRLDETVLRANLAISTNRLREASARRARLIAERDDAETIQWTDRILISLGISIDENITAGQQKLFGVRKATQAGQILQLQQKIAQFENRIIGLEALRKSKDAQIALLEEELLGKRLLKEKGLTPAATLLVLERQKEELVGQNAERDAELGRIDISISETGVQILQIDREFQQSVLTELRQVDLEVGDLSQQLHATAEQLKRAEIRAPAAGIIHELAVSTIGGVISPGAIILQIVPQDEKFEFEVQIDPQFIDELSLGQKTVLRFTTFNQRTTPELAGTIRSISPNISINPQTGASFYKMIIDVPPEQLARLNGQKLVPGMPLETFTQTQERSPLNYLIKPLLDQIRHVGRER